MPKTPLPILPDDIILEIFKRLPLEDLFYRIRPIRCWRLILQIELNRRKTLYLYSYDSNLRWDCPYRELLDHVRRDDGPAWPETLPTCALPNEAQLKFACMPMCDAMKATLTRNPLPNITNLSMQHYRVTLQLYRGIIRLIRLWSPKLISLRITFHFEDNVHHPDVAQNLDTMVLALFEALNNIPTLRHLYLHLQCPKKFHPGNGALASLPDNLRFSFLSHLHTFCFNAEWINNTIECLFASLREHAIANEHLRICMHPSQLSTKEVMKLTPELSRKFTRIEVRVNEILILPFCTQFSSLTTLSLYCEPYMMAQFSQHLRLLPNLFILDLSFGMNEYAHFERPDQDEDEDKPEPEYFQVPSVRVLRTEISTESHDNISQLQIAHIFPNLQVIQFEHISKNCLKCDYDITDMEEIESEDELEPDLRRKVIECMRLARQPFRACASLRIIEYSDNPFHSYDSKLITANQLRNQRSDNLK